MNNNLERTWQGAVGGGGGKFETIQRNLWYNTGIFLHKLSKIRVASPEIMI